MPCIYTQGGPIHTQILNAPVVWIPVLEISHVGSVVCRLMPCFLNHFSMSGLHIVALGIEFVLYGLFAVCDRHVSTQMLTCHISLNQDEIARRNGMRYDIAEREK